MSHIVFGIETRPRTDAERFFAPPPPFDPLTVKMGNIKDQALRTAKIEADREAHQRMEADVRANFFDKAALSPLTGEIVAISAAAVATGLGTPHAPQRCSSYTGYVGYVEVTGGVCDEAGLLRGFLGWAMGMVPRPLALVSWSGSNQSGAFDADFLWRRCVALGVEATWMSSVNHIDATHYLLQYAKPMTFLSLRNACMEVGLDPSYDGPCTGAEFASMLGRGGSDAEEAIRYLEADVDDLEAVWTKVLQALPSDFNHYYGRSEQ